MKEPGLKELAQWHAVPLGTPLQHLPLISGASGLELRRTSNQGRGIFLTKDYPQGSLLFIERAFSLGTNAIELCIATATALEKSKKRSPSSCRRYFALEGGHHVPEADSLDWWLRGDGLGGPDVLPAAKIPIINGLNCLKMTATSETDGMQDTSFSAVLFVAALMNHACVPTASLQYVGDAVFVRSACDLHVGDELTNAYIPTYLGFAARQAELKAYKFTCDCLRCQAESLVPHSLQPSFVVPSECSMRTAYDALHTARAAERFIVANAPQELLENIDSSGLRLRGCFLCPSFQALMQRLCQLDSGDPEASFVAELMQEAVAAALPNSPTHSFCCSNALTVIGSQGKAYQGALNVIAARALTVHDSCYGGGRAFWLYRLKGSSAFPFASASPRVSLLNAPSMLCCRLHHQAVLIELATFWASRSDSLEVFASDAELRISSPHGKTQSIPCPCQDLSLKYDRFSRCLSVAWPVPTKSASLEAVSKHEVDPSISM